MSPAGARIAQLYGSTPTNLDCLYLGEFEGHSGYGGAMLQFGRRNAKSLALNKAGALGATHVVWYPFTDGFWTRERLSAYRCSSPSKAAIPSNTAPTKTKKADKKPKVAQTQQSESSRKKESTTPKSGTGWISTGGYVVTNNHVVEGATSITFYLRNGKEVPLKMVVFDKANDLALLQAEDIAVLPLGLSISKEPAVMGASVFTIGYPHPDLLGTQQKLANGAVSSSTGMQGDPRYMQLTVPVQSGNSGGPLLNMKGEVVGVISMKLSALAVRGTTGDLTENVAYALKADFVKAIMPIDVNATLAPPALVSAPELETIAAAVRDGIGMIIAR